MHRHLVLTLLATLALSCTEGSAPAPTSGAPAGGAAATSASPSHPPPPAHLASSTASPPPRDSASAPPSALPEAPPPVDDARRSIAFNPDGRSFVTARGRAAAIVIVANGEKRPLTGIEDDIAFLSFSRNGDRLATVTTKLVVQVWDARTGAALGTMPEGISDNEIDDVEFSPDGRLLAGTGRTVTRIWDIAEKRKVCETSGALAFNLAFTPDQQSLVTSGVGIITRFDATTCEQKASASANTGGTFGSWVAPDGLHVAAAGGDGHELQLFAGRDFHPVQTMTRSAGCTDHVNATFSRDGKVLLANGGTTWLRSYDLESLKTIAAYEIPFPDRVTFALSFDDGRRALIGRVATAPVSAPGATSPVHAFGATAELVSLTDKKVAFTLALEGAETVDVSWDQKRLLGAAKDKVLLWDSSNGKLLQTFELP